MQMLEERFWSKVDKSGGCWLWRASRFLSTGYGRIHVNGRSCGAHRIAWELTFGTIPEGLFVCHRCDNKTCCNPAHLFLGTADDNMQDKTNKGRATRGADVNTCRLSRDQVQEVRAEYRSGKVTQQQLANRYGVKQPAISKIVLRTSWAWLSE